MKDLARIHYLFVTFEPTEVALLRALGLPAALAAGLDRTKVFHLHQLEARDPAAHETTHCRGPPVAPAEEGQASAGSSRRDGL